MSDHELPPLTHSVLVRELDGIAKWDALGFHLGLSTSDIREIERDHRGDTVRQRMEMLDKWLKKELNPTWIKVIDALNKMSENSLASLLRNAYAPSPNAELMAASNPPSLEERELTIAIDQNDDIAKAIDDLGDEYYTLIRKTESAVEKENPSKIELKRFSQHFMNSEVTTVEELFDLLKPFYFLNYPLLKKIVKFFFNQTHPIVDNFRDYLDQLATFMQSTTVLQFMESIEQTQQLHSTTSERPGLCTVKLRLIGGWLTKTMDDLEKLVNEIFKDKVHVLSHLKIVRGSVIVIFSAPLSEADSIDILVREQSLFALKVGVSLLVVADTVITQSESTDFSFESSLLNSVMDNDPNILSFLLSINTNPDTADKNGQTALMIACVDNQQKSTRLLLKANSNPNVLDSNGRSSLYLASREGHTDTVALLLKANANPNLQGNNGCTPLYIASQNGHTDTVALLLKANANPNLQKDNGVTPLYIASQNGHTDTVALLLKANANSNLQGKKWLHTSLHC